MEKNYSEELLQAIEKKQYYKDFEGVNVLMKPIPDCDEEGMVDTRLYKDSKKMAMLMRIMPKSLMKFDTSPKGIKKLREMFNGIKSRPVTSEKIEIIKETIKGLDDNDIPVLVYLPLERKENLPILYYIHGGGFFGGHPGVVEQLVKMIVEKFNIVAFSVDYRLAPENPYPKGHEDCYEGLKWVHANAKKYGGNPDFIFVAGDSAGGNLAQYCTTKDKENNGHMVKGQMLLYPTVNMAGIDDAYAHWSLDKYSIHPKHKKVVEVMLSMMGGDTGMSSLLGDILGTTEVNNDYLSPYGMDVKGMPPTLITVGEHDFLFVECLAYAKKLVDANVDTTTIVYKGMGHAYGDNIGVYPQSEDCANELGKFILKYSQE